MFVCLFFCVFFCLFSSLLFSPVGSPVIVEEAGQQHRLMVVEVHPTDTVCTVNCDPEIEFDEPVHKRAQEHALLKLNADPVSATVSPENAHLFWFSTTEEEAELDLIIEVSISSSSVSASLCFFFRVSFSQKKLFPSFSGGIH
jgi:hypothetical protein